MGNVVCRRTEERLSIFERESMAARRILGVQSARTNQSTS